MTGPTSQPLPTGTRQLACARCGAAFACNLNGPCWCGEEALRLPLPGEASPTGFTDCLCRDCLRTVAASNAIVESLERAAERCEDLTPLVYARLFRVRPETRAMFRAEANDLVKGSMLQLALEAILDFAGERKASHRLILCEVQSHDGYGTPPELFNVFFAAIADTVRDLLGEDWSPTMETAWRKLRDDLDRYVDDAVRAMQPAG
ncbi:cysteine-rich CWC family protein [Bradyrhizobium sp. LHD-71]|uniref:cysteine-rich CWC family protein n=1 Tax=Bradyrhizobium sp. LHD-71 TaxID=3072141 RepID=UPI00280D386F|nr:cysteine-rich CWC family protein [Bradyrhizobium sp. LHD-71]MDQ8729064.1 globin domain-containing protein [Bradyrhizobium sp. LHD-71]